MTSAKPLFLTPRDQEFLVDLYDLVFLDVEYLSNYIYEGSDPTIYRRLQKLEENGYIKSFRLPLLESGPSGRSKKVFTLDKKGVDEIREIIGDVNWRYDTADRAPSHVYHQLMLAQVKGAYATKESDSFGFYEYLNEKRSYYQHVDKEHEEKSVIIRPDATVILEKQGNYAAFMLELERSRQRKEVSIEKLKRYNRYCQNNYFKEHQAFDVEVRAPRIVFISNQENQMKRLIEHTKDVNTNSVNGVLYTTYEKIVNDPFGEIFLAKGSTDTDRLYRLNQRIE